MQNGQRFEESKHKVEGFTVLLVFQNILAACLPVFVNQKKASEVSICLFEGEIYFLPPCVNTTSLEVCCAVCTTVISVLFQMNSNSQQQRVVHTFTPYC